MAGRDDDLIDLASDLADDPELADTFAKLAEGAQDVPPRSGSEFKNPLQGFVDRERITPKYPQSPAPSPGFTPQPPPASSRRAPAGPPQRGIRAFIATPVPSSVRGGAPHSQPMPQSARSVPQASPSNPGSTPIPLVATPSSTPIPLIATPISTPIPLVATPSSSPIPLVSTPRSGERPASSIPGVAPMYQQDRDTPTVRFTKSPDSMPTPLPEDLEAEETSEEKRITSPSPVSAPSLLDDPTPSGERGPTSVTLSGANGSADDDQNQLASSSEETAEANAAAERSGPRVWLLAVAALLAAAGTLAVLLVLGPLSGSTKPTPAPPSAAPTQSAAPKIEATTNTAKVEPTQAAPVAETAAPTTSASAAPEAPTATPTTEPAIASAPQPALSFHPMTPLTGRLPKSTAPISASGAATAAPKPSATSKPINGPIFELEN